MICYFSCEFCPKGKQLTLNPRQVHMKNNISYIYNMTKKGSILQFIIILLYSILQFIIILLYSIL